jgi:hypothetical protein
MMQIMGAKWPGVMFHASKGVRAGAAVDPYPERSGHHHAHESAQQGGPDHKRRSPDALQHTLKAQELGVTTDRVRSAGSED